LQIFTTIDFRLLYSLYLQKAYGEEIMKLKTPILIILSVIILVGLFFALKPNTKTSTNTNQIPSTQQATGGGEIAKTNNNDQEQKNTFELVIKSKKIVSGPTTITVNQGDDVTIKITSDEDEEFHVHAYDNFVKLEPNKEASLTFNARFSGRFPFELELSKTELGALEVQPNP
jgi:hypothetical protein